MAKSKQAPEEPVEHDEFLSMVDKAAAALKPHAKLLSILAGVFFAGLVGWTVWRWHANNVREAATAEFASARRAAHGAVVGPDQEQASARAAGVAPPESFATVEAKREAVKARWQQVIQEAGSLGVADVARFHSASLHVASGDYDRAVAEYRQLGAASLPWVLRVSALENVGLTLEAAALALDNADQRQTKLEQALEAFATMEKAPSTSRQHVAIFHQARMHALLGNKDKARELFDRILVEFPDSSLVPATKTRIASLDPA